MSTDSVGRSKRGGAVTLVGQLGRALVQFLSVVVLSRLLPPSDFGLIAIATVLVALGEFLRDAGLTTTALRSPRLSRQQASNLFWTNTALAVVMAALIAVSSPVLVSVFDEPRLLMVAPAMGMIVVFTGLQAQVTVHLAREQKFTAIAVSDVVSQVVGFIIAISTALAGWGYWALVAQLVAAALTLVVLRWILARWWPLPPRRGHGSKHLLTSGLDYAASQVVTFLASNVDSLVIGAQWGSTSLGFYNRAFQLLNMPLARALTPLNNVAVPTLTRIREAGHDVFTYLQKLQALISVPTTLAFAVAAGSASSLIPILLGDAWQPTILLFQILAIAGALRGLDHLNYWAFLVLGSSRQFLASIVATKAITIVLVISGALISTQFAAWAYALSILLTWLINFAWLSRITDIPWRRFLGHGLLHLLAGATATGAGILTSAHSTGSLLLDALLQCVAGCSVFLMVLLAVPAGREDFSTVVRTARQVLRRRG